MSTSLHRLLDDHAVEGTSVLVAEPAMLIRFLNLLVAGVVCAVVIWAFIARADVIVSASGTLVPAQDIRRVYAPIDGELVDVYASVGVPVRQGDIVARINARGAIEAASKVVEANIRLADARLVYERFPDQRALLEQKIASIQSRLTFLQKDYDERLEDGLLRLAEAQRAKLVEARSMLEQAARKTQAAQTEAQQFERLFAMPGGGGISKAQVEQKRNAYLDAQAQQRNAEARLSSLEFELGNALAQADKNLASAAQEIAEARIQIEQTRRQIEREQAEVEVRLRSAELAAESAQRVSFENFDENNFLKIHAPITGVVTQVPFTQQGDKISASQPLLSIAPEGAEKILRVRINEQDRGFLAVGQAAKLKFNAFPHQSYGSIPGQLEYISPTIVNDDKSNVAAYEGKIRLEVDQVDTARGPMSLRYGMGAVAEIVVRERRVIDFALDPLRRLK